MTTPERGTRIRAIRNTQSWGGDPFPEGTELVYASPAAVIDGDGFDWVAGWPEGIRPSEYLVNPADFVLAAENPDPASVQEDDTVTLVRNSAAFTGTVSDISRGTDMAGVSVTSFAFFDMPGWFDMFGLEAWTLTDHQPAPEPVVPGFNGVLPVTVGSIIKDAGLGGLDATLIGGVWRWLHDGKETDPTRWTGGWTLERLRGAVTASVPAPEPDPEWRPGTVLEDAQGARYLAGANGAGEPRLYAADGSFVIPPKTDLRPLVVLDPENLPDLDTLRGIYEEADEQASNDWHDYDATAGIRAVFDHIIKENTK